MKSIKKLIFLLLTANVCCLKAQNNNEIKPPKLTTNISLQNMFYWRGAPISVFSSNPQVPSPVIIGSAEYRKNSFSLGIWTGHSFDSQGFKNASIYIGYNIGNLSIQLWDSYTYAGISKSKSVDFFNYSNKKTQHFIDLDFGYQFDNIPLKLFWATVVYGRDGVEINGTYKNRYSTFFREDYTRRFENNTSINFYTSIGGALNDIDEYSFYGTANATDSFGVTEIGIDVGKKVVVTKSYSIPISVGVVASPLNKRIDGILTIKLF